MIGGMVARGVCKAVVLMLALVNGPLPCQVRLHGGSEKR